MRASFRAAILAPLFSTAACPADAPSSGMPVPLARRVADSSPDCSAAATLARAG